MGAPTAKAAGQPGRRPPSETDAREQLGRILAAAPFRSSPRRRELLRYLAEETLAGRGERLKGYTIATEVFGRDESFEASTDPVVRLEARRLRRDLDSYYAGEGAGDPVRISIPKGGYLVQFDRAAQAAAPLPEATPSEAPAPGGDMRMPWRAIAAGLALAVIALVALALWALARPAGPERLGSAGPALVVQRFDPLGLGEDGRVLAEGVSQQLVSELMRFSALRIYSAPAGGAVDMKEVGQRLGVTYLLSGSVSFDAPSVRVVAQLTDIETGQVRWSSTFDRTLTAGDMLAVQADIAAGIATVLGQPYGVVKSDVTDRVLNGSAVSAPSYACVLRAYAYRRSFATALYQPARTCLEAAVARDPGYPDAWAMLGWVQLDAVRFRYDFPGSREAALATALATARQAVDLDPRSVLGLQALASIEYYAGRYDEAEQDQRAALALNPNDPDTMAQLGWRLAARGNWDTGIPLLERAIARTIDPPGWYFHLIAAHQYIEGDYEEMLATAERSAVGGSSISQSLIAIAEGALGNRPAAEQALAKMAAIDTELGRDPAAVYRGHQVIEPTVAALVAGLRTAGWRPPTN